MKPLAPPAPERVAAPAAPSVSLARLLWHEIRLGTRLPVETSAMRFLGGLLLLGLGPVVIGLAVARDLADAATRPGPVGQAILVATHFVLLTLMVSLAAVQVMRTFRERNDLDLLLSAPVPVARVFLAKAFGAVWMVALPFMVMLAPFLLFSTAHGHWPWLAALPVILATAAIATGAGFVIVARLIGWLGGRRARLLVHLGTAGLGAGLFIAAQLAGLGAGGEDRPAALARLTSAMPPAPFNWGGRALVGEPLPLLGIAGIGLAAVLLAVGPGAARIAVPDRDSEAALRRALPIRPHAGPLAALVSKELRLLWRDPETLAQVLLRFIYLVPLIWLAAREGADPQVVGRQLLAGGVALAVMASSSLAWITLCAEEARDLVEAAPVSRLAREGAKLAVACGLPLLVLAGLAPVVAGFSGRAALLLVLLSPPAALAMAILQAWHGPRIPRTAFRKRPGALLIMGLTEIVMAGCWAALAVMLHNRAPLAFIPALAIAAILAIGAAARRPPR